MANFIKKYDSVSQYNSDSEKQYPNISYIEATGELKWMKAIQFETVYTVDDASQPVTLFNDNGAITGMEVDGNEVPLTTFYTFSTTGEHVVKYSLNDNSAIGSGTFTDVTALTGVTFPPTVENIGLEAFKGCTGLTSITLPSGAMRTLGTSSFEDCTNLSSVTIEYSLYEIGQAAFKGCTSLTSINIPDSVGSIGEEAFKNSGLTGDVYLPSTVRTISDRCFEGCLNLSGIRYSGRYNYLTSIGSGAFKDCVNLTVCTYLNDDNLQEIGHNAFENTGFTNITIPPYYIYVWDEAFKGCTNLTRLDIYGTPNAFGQNVFKDCPSLTDIHVRFASPDKFTSLCGSVDAQVSGRTVKVPIGCVEAYSNSEHWQCFAGEIVEENRRYTYAGKSFTKKYTTYDGPIPLMGYDIGGNYDDYLNNKWVNLADWQYLYMLDNGEYNLQPETLLQLPRPEAPQDALWVTVTYDITDTDNPTRLAFRDNSFLAMKIDNELQSDVVREYTFTTAGTHTVEYALESSKFFPTYAFGDISPTGAYGALNIPATSIVIPSGIEEIGGYAFAGLQHLASVTFPASIKKVAATAFDGSSWLENQPDGVIYIGNIAWKYKGTMPEQASITIADGTTEISDKCFEDNTTLTYVALPSTVTRIGALAFYRCGIRGIVIPSSVTTIGERAYESTSYPAVNSYATTPPALEGAAENLFGNVGNVQAIYVPAESVEAYKAAAGWSTWASLIEAMPEPQYEYYVTNQFCNGADLYEHYEMSVSYNKEVSWTPIDSSDPHYQEPYDELVEEGSAECQQEEEPDGE